MIMPRVSKASDGIQMKGGPQTAHPGPEFETKVMNDPEAIESSGPQFLEKCEVLTPSRAEAQNGTAYGITWTFLDRDKDGTPYTYLCEDRAMKITANLRREKGESITPQTEWLFFTMNALVAKSTDLQELLQKAAGLR